MRSEQEVMAELQSLLGGGQSQDELPPNANIQLRPTGKETTARGTTNEVINVGDYRTQKEMEEEINQVYKSRSSLDEYTSDAMQALTALDKIEKESNNLGDFDRGVLPQTYARVKTGIKEYAKDKDITRYLGVINQELIPMARKLMEEKGPITESDILRVQKGFGDLTTPLEDKIFLVNEFRDKVKQALKHKMQSSQMDETYFSSKYKDLYSKAFKKSEGNTGSNTDSNDIVAQARAEIERRAGRK